jgi:hypothetical protein
MSSPVLVARTSGAKIVRGSSSAGGAVVTTPACPAGTPTP